MKLVDFWWLTQIAGLAVEGVELLLIGPLLVVGSGDNEQATSPSEPAITENLSPDLSGTLVPQWELCTKTRSLCLCATYSPYYCQRVTTRNYGQKPARSLHCVRGDSGLYGNKRQPVFRHLQEKMWLKWFSLEEWQGFCYFWFSWNTHTCMLLQSAKCCSELFNCGPADCNRYLTDVDTAWWDHPVIPATQTILILGGTTYIWHQSQ